MNQKETQLLKGVLTMMLLKLLTEEENYGYAVVVKLRDLGFNDLNEGSVYPALSRLEKQGLLASRLQTSSSGPARKYYSTTPNGRESLTAAMDTWQELKGRVETLLQGGTKK